MKIAVVIPWFGKDLHGGAEQVAYQIAKRLADAHEQVEVLTTCCSSFFDPWDENDHPPGLREEDGVQVRRFPVQGRDQEGFDRVVRKLLSLRPDELEVFGPVLRSEEEDVYWQEQLRCPELLEYVKNHQHEYDRFLLLPYLFALVTDVAQIVGPKAVVQPCLHDECYARLRRVQNLMLDAGWLVFNSEGEKQLAIQRFGKWVEHKSSVIGLGVEKTEDSLRESPVKGRFLFYLGRRLREKGVSDLIAAFESFRKEYDTDLKLVLAGPGDIDGAGVDGVVNLGKVSHDDKVALLHNCVALINPSPQESFSRVIYEAWFARRPVLVNQDCLATHYAVLGSEGGGWSVPGHVKGFEAGIALIEQMTEDHLVAAGECGETWAHKTAEWSGVIARLQEVMASPPPFHQRSCVVSAPLADDHEKARYRRALRGTRHHLAEQGMIESMSSYQGRVNIACAERSGWATLSPQKVVGRVFDLFGASAMRCVQKKVTGSYTPRVLVETRNQDFRKEVAKNYIDVFDSVDLRRRDALFIRSIDLVVVDMQSTYEISDAYAMGVPAIFVGDETQADEHTGWIVTLGNLSQAISFLLHDDVARKSLVKWGYEQVEMSSAGHWQSQLMEIESEST